MEQERWRRIEALYHSALEGPPNRAAFLAEAALAAVLGLIFWNPGRWLDRLAPRPPVKPIESLAVLPLENLSGNPEQEYFGDGMSDELIAGLAKISALRVVSQTSVEPYRGSKKSLTHIARELHVDAVVEGTGLRAQNRRPYCRATDPRSPEEHLWAEKYEGNLKDVLTLQDAVPQDIASSIKIRLTPRECTLPATPRPVDPTAYEAYLKGCYWWRTSEEQGVAKSLGYLEQEPLVALAEVKRNYEWDWAGAERLCKQATESVPNYGEAHHVYATPCHQSLGNPA
jgi:TolB-like protein